MISILDCRGLLHLHHNLVIILQHHTQPIIHQHSNLATINQYNNYLKHLVYHRLPFEPVDFVKSMKGIQPNNYTRQLQSSVLPKLAMPSNVAAFGNNLPTLPKSATSIFFKIFTRFHKFFDKTVDSCHLWQR